MTRLFQMQLCLHMNLRWLVEALIKNALGILNNATKSISERMSSPNTASGGAT